MDVDSAVRLLRAKLDALANSGGVSAHDSARLRRSIEIGIRAALLEKRPLVALKDHDAELTTVMRLALGRKRALAIIEGLQRAHGEAGLGPSPEQVAQRVLARGSVADLQEARVLRDLLSDASLAPGAEQALALERHLSAWESDPRNRE